MYILILTMFVNGHGIVGVTPAISAKFFLNEQSCIKAGEAWLAQAKSAVGVDWYVPKYLCMKE